MAKISKTHITLFFLLLTTFISVYLYFIMSGEVAPLDTWVTQYFADLRTPPLTSAALWITLLGNDKVVVLTTVITSVVLLLLQHKRDLIPFLVSILGGGAVTFLTKILVARPRPELAYYTEHSYSFPSGHSTVAVTLYGFVAWLLIRNIPSKAMRVVAYILATAGVVTIGLTRLYLGVHYFSDVLGGLVVGSMALVVAIATSAYLGRKYPEQQTSTIPVWSRVMTILIILLGLAYIVYAGSSFTTMEVVSEHLEVTE